MKQTQKSLLGLGAFLVLALAIGLAALWAKRSEEVKEEEKEKAEKLFTFEKEKVRSVQLFKNGKLEAEAVREAGKPWTLASPAKVAADQNAVNAIVDKLAELKQKKDLGADTDPKQPGLDAPRWKVQLALDDKTSPAPGLEVGADNSFDNTTYVRKAGEPTVRIIDGQHKSAWDKSAFDLRDKRVAQLEDNAEVTAFSVINEDPYTLQKDGAGWKLTGPGNETPEPADAATIDRILATIKGLRATAVAAEKGEPGKYGLAQPLIAIELNEPAALKRSIAIGQAAAKTFAKRSDGDAIYEVDAQIVRDLKKSWFDLQEKTVAKFDREAVHTLQIDAPGAAQIAVARSKDAKDGGMPEENFAVLAPASGLARRWKISSALHTLGSLRAAAFAGDAPREAKGLAKYGLDQPRVYSLLGEGGKVLARLKLGGPALKDGKRVYALAEGAARVVEVEQATVDDLPRTLDDVLEPPPPPPGADGGAPAVQAGAPK